MKRLEMPHTDTEVLDDPNTETFGEILAEVDAALPTQPSQQDHDSTTALVTERGRTHGAFSDHARCTQKLKDVVKIELYKRHQRGQPELSVQHKESIDMILHKIGRIIAGEATFDDHWDDIAGYAKIANKVF